MKKAIEIASWLLILIYLLIAVGFITDKQNKIICTSVEVVITDSTNNDFVEKDYIISMIYSNDEKLSQHPIESINIAKIESIILNHPSIKNVEIYKTINGTLKIEIEQRNPIIRIISNNNESYYIDEQKTLMPLSDKYTAHVLIASGYINNSFALNDLFYLAKYIYNNKLWHSQIEQIYVNKNKEIELIPKVGSHIILFGGIEDCKQKFRKLKALYQKGLNIEGWNKYKIINLKYKNQVVCTKR